MMIFLDCVFISRCLSETFFLFYCALLPSQHCEGKESAFSSDILWRDLFYIPPPNMSSLTSDLFAFSFPHCALLCSEAISRF